MSESNTVPPLDIAFRVWGSIEKGPVVVLLHEGLGSITQWRDFPSQLHANTGLTVMAYDRSGYGRSAAGEPKYDADFMHREALEALPELLARLHISEPILIGHSDGGTIALIHAASPSNHPKALVTIAAHAYVEDIAVNQIKAATHRRSEIVKGLAQHHNDPENAFDRWANVWLSGDFQAFDIRSDNRDITCPVLVIQGDVDEYATKNMLPGIASSIENAESCLVSDCGHIVHKDQPDVLISEIKMFLHRNAIFGHI